MTPGPVQVCVILPTLNEAANLPLVAQRIAAALRGVAYEILVVDDDSADGTAGVCRELGGRYPLRLLVRRDARDGLSGAVLAGMAATRAPYLAVMDADLQHPPHGLLALLEPLVHDQADFVIGSRYVAGGSIAGPWGWLRRCNSRLATLLARPFAPGVCDPMSGFFALRRDTYLQAQRLTPLGYKIGLELMCKCQVRRVREVPIHFGLRAGGRSKLTVREQFRYLEHLSRLYDFTFPRASPMIKFAIATAAAWLTGLAAMIGARSLGIVPAAAAAYLAAIVCLSVFHGRYVRTQRQFLRRPHPWHDFIFGSACELTACAAAASWARHRVADPTLAEIFLLSFTAATITRYILRKELLQDVRGLRTSPREQELGGGLPVDAPASRLDERSRAA